MGFLNQSEFDRLKAAAESLTAEQRSALTWEQARQFIAADTAELNMFAGDHERKELTPWQAVARIRGIAE